MARVDRYGPSKGFLVGVGCLAVATLVGFLTLYKMISGVSRGLASGTQAAPAARCVAVDETVLALVAARLTVPGLAVRNGWAVRSRDHRAMTFVSAELASQESAFDGRVETWAFASDQPGEGALVAVSPMAVALSDWPDGTADPFAIGNLDDGAEASRTCVRIHRSRRPPAP